MELSIFAYNDISGFLEAFRQRKSSRRKLTMLEVARKLGYSSDRTLGMVYAGSRVISSEMRRRLANILNFSPKEVVFLDYLVEKQKLQIRNKSTAEVDRKLLALRPVKSEYISLTELELSQITAWYYFPIKNLVRLSPEGISAQEIVQRLESRVSFDEIKSALDVLVRLKIIKSKDKCYFPLNSKYHVFGFDVPSESIKIAHKNMLKRAISALDEQCQVEREYNSKTIIVSKSKISVAKKKIREFCETLSDELINTSEGDKSEVYQLSLQFFRQAKEGPK